MVQTFEDVRSVANALGWGCEYSQTLGDDICVDIYRDSPAGCELYFAYDVKSPADMAAEVRADADWEFDEDDYIEAVCNFQTNPLTRSEAEADAAAAKDLLRELADYLESWRGD